MIGVVCFQVHVLAADEFDEARGRGVAPFLAVFGAVDGGQPNLVFHPGSRDDHGVAVDHVFDLVERQVGDGFRRRRWVGWRGLGRCLVIRCGIADGHVG